MNTTPQNELLLAEIREAHSRGWALTVLRGKKPTRNGWQSEEPLALRFLEKWAGHGNVGVRTGSVSGIAVVDCDEGADVDALALPQTVTAETGGGGQHYYFKPPKGETIRNSVGKLADHVDVRSEGGQIVLPGSVHPQTGKLYEWREGRSPDDLPIADFPAHLLKLLRPRRSLKPSSATKGGNGRNIGPYVRAAVDRELKSIQEAQEGQRNATLNSAAFKLGGLVHTGEIDEQTIARKCLDSALAAGLHESEARATIASGIQAGLANPREIPERGPVTRTGTPKTGSVDAKNVVENAPLAIAEHFLRERYTATDGKLLLGRHRDETFIFNGASYQSVSDERLGSELYCHTENLVVAKRSKGTGLVPLRVNSHLVDEVRKAIPSRGCLLDERQDPPFWTDGREEPDPSKLLALQNGYLELRSGKLHAPTPELFTTTSVPVEYDPNAPEPKVFVRFLDSAFGDERESIDTLQEWFGYVLIPDTSQQKSLLVNGPKRSGKGTIARVLVALLGQNNVAGPTLSSLAQNFGLAGLIGKGLAIISDARLSGRSDQAVIVERLLSISGEDYLSVSRKHLTDWVGKLPTRFMLLTNELPRLPDTSGALAGRFIVLKLTRSFYGKEDPILTDRICEELPGILNWAIAGWARLDQRGYFVQPEASTDTIRELEDLGSPVNAFVRDRCVVASSHSVEVQKLYEEWRRWCNQSGREHPGTVQTLGRDLHAAVPGLRNSKPRDASGKRRSHYEGIGLCEK